MHAEMRPAVFEMQERSVRGLTRIDLQQRFNFGAIELQRDGLALQLASRWLDRDGLSEWSQPIDGSRWRTHDLIARRANHSQILVNRSMQRYFAGLVGQIRRLIPPVSPD
jgi:hypothetical protein